MLPRFACFIFFLVLIDVGNGRHANCWYSERSVADLTASICASNSNSTLYFTLIRFNATHLFLLKGYESLKAHEVWFSCQKWPFNDCIKCPVGKAGYLKLPPGFMGLILPLNKKIRKIKSFDFLVELKNSSSVSRGKEQLPGFKAVAFFKTDV